jgi:biotin operon repressor
MTKQHYNVGDIVWIYGVGNSNKSIEGTIVHKFYIDQEGYDYDQDYYVISIPTEIGPLLEVRTWETISETKDGYVGSLRQALGNSQTDISANIKFMRTTGMAITEPRGDFEDDDPSPDIVNAAIESQINSTRTDTIYRPRPKSNRRYHSKRKQDK